MKNKILGLPKAAVIVIGIVITALFLVLMNLVGGVVAHLTSITDSYTLQLIAEIGVAIYAIGMLFLMGYQQSLKKTGVGFLRGFYIGGFILRVCGSCTVIFAECFRFRRSAFCRWDHHLHIDNVFRRHE